MFKKVSFWLRCNTKFENMCLTRGKGSYGEDVYMNWKLLDFSFFHFQLNKYLSFEFRAPTLFRHLVILKTNNYLPVVVALCIFVFLNRKPNKNHNNQSTMKLLNLPLKTFLSLLLIVIFTQQSMSQVSALKVIPEVQHFDGKSGTYKSK